MNRMKEFYVDYQKPSKVLVISRNASRTQDVSENKNDMVILKSSDGVLFSFKLRKSDSKSYVNLFTITYGIAMNKSSIIYLFGLRNSQSVSPALSSSQLFVV